MVASGKHGLQVQWGVMSGVVGVAIIAVLLFAPIEAKADVTICTLGSGAGQCDAPAGVSADPVTGLAYVADGRNNRIDVFDSTGSFLFAFGWGVDDGSSSLQKCTTATGCQKGIAGAGPGQLERPVALAVDHAAERLYVTDDSYRVQEFDLNGAFIREFGEEGAGECQFSNPGRPIAVGATGSVYVADAGAVKKFAEDGSCLGKISLATVASNFNFLAVDSDGNIYAPAVPDSEGRVLGKFGPTGSQLCYGPHMNASIEAAAVSPTGDLFLVESYEAINRPKEFSLIGAYSSTCEPLRRFAYQQVGTGLEARYKSVSFYASSSGDVFVSQGFGGSSEGSRVEYVEIPPEGPVAPAPGVEAPADLITGVKATLRAEVNPEGEATQVHFEYLTQEEWEAQGQSFSGLATRVSATQEITATDLELHSVETFIGCTDPVNDPPSTCLVPETTYRYRVVATNGDGPGDGAVEGQPFETKAAVEIASTFVTAVGIDDARLNAEVNPLGIPTTGYFEYVTDADYQATGFANALQVPDVAGGATELSFGADEDPVLRSVALTSLSPATIFHYRISVTDPLLGTDRVIGPERIFRTFATPTAAASCPANEAFRTGVSTLLGDCRAYELVSPLEKGSGDVVPPVEIISGRPATLNQSAISGDKIAYGSYRAFGDAEAGPYTSQYIAERQSDGWLSHTITPPRGRSLTEIGLQTDTEVKMLSSDLCEEWLATVAEAPLAPGAVSGFRNLYHRQDGGSCGAGGYEALTSLTPAHPENAKFMLLELQGVSEDSATVVYTVNNNLQGTQAPDNPDQRQQLYERTTTGTEFACILPNEQPVTGSCSAGTEFLNTNIVSGQNRAASLDNALSSDGQRLFWTAYDPVVLVKSVPVRGPGQIYLRIGGSNSIPVSEQAEEESGTSSSIFLKADDAGTEALFVTGEDLYRFDVASEATTLVAHDVPGIVGASNDLGRVYLVSEEELAGENPQGKSPTAGDPNLYLEEDGSFEFIATLAPDDVRPFPSVQFGGTSATSFAAFTRSSRISPDGSHAVFMSSGSPTGYDSVDADSGEADAEVYRYDASDDQVLCVSCNPTNSRPSGSDIVRGVFSFWAAGSISGWENTLYNPRNLSEDGNRVFFESSDALSPLDSNGVGDVYEWELPGVGSCTESVASYSPLNGGCVQLLSSGQSGRASEFNDATPSGDDVFFSTLASLVSHDYGLVDIYDARVNGGLPSPPAPAPECEGESCQNPGPAPAVASATSLGYRGPGNVSEKKKKKCPKGKVRRHGRCVKKPHKKGKHHKKQAGKSGRAGR